MDLRVTGILDSNGGIRIVITPESQIPCHINEGDRAYVTPLILDRLPSFDQYPALVDKVIEYVKTHAG